MHGAGRTATSMPNAPGYRIHENGCLPVFSGTHNFSSFARVEDRNPLRTILRISVMETDGFVCLEVTAESFLWHQVRSMAAALLRVGNGEADTDSIARLLTSAGEKPLQPAPAEGLILHDTDCGITWTPLPPHERKLRVYQRSLAGTMRSWSTCAGR